MECIPFQLARDVEADTLGHLSDAGDLPAGAGLPLDPKLDDDSSQDQQLLSQRERDAVQLARIPKRLSSSTRRRTATLEEDVLKEIRDSMKASTELLSQLVQKGNQGPRESFITYMSESLRTLPDAQYQVVMKQFTSFLHNFPYPQPQQYPFNQPQNYSQQQYTLPTPTFQQAPSTSLQTTQESTQPQYTLMTQSTSTPSTSFAPEVTSVWIKAEHSE